MREFIRRHLPKPGHVEQVTARGHLVSCGCGTVWKAATWMRNSEGREFLLALHEQACPDCGKGATVATTSAIEEWVERVTIGDGAVPNRGKGLVRP